MSDYHKPKIPNQDILNGIKEKFTYNPNKGILYRDYEEVGSVQKFCLRVKYRDKPYQVHHICWFLHYGEWPSNQIDHKDRDWLNNKIDNLRVVTSSIQNRNRNLKGYYFNKSNKKYQAYIKINGKYIHLGCFVDEQNAIKARKEAEILHGYR